MSSHWHGWACLQNRANKSNGKEDIAGTSAPKSALLGESLGRPAATDSKRQGHSGIQRARKLFFQIDNRKTKELFPRAPRVICSCSPCPSS